MDQNACIHLFRPLEVSKMKRTLTLTLMMSVSTLGVAYAHAHLEKAIPADGSVLSAAPKQLMLHFSEATQITALTIQKGEESKQTLSPPTEPTAMVAVALPKLSVGRYVVNYRAMGDDNHIVNGEIHFTVSDRAMGKKADEAYDQTNY